MKQLKYPILYILLLFVAACEKDTLPMNFSPALTTGAASDIYRVGATLSGSIQKSDGVVVKDCGILISELQSMAEYTEIKTASTENTFDVIAQNLEPGKKYYYCAYASSGYSIARGEIKEFTTTDSNAPVFSELAVSGKDEKSFTVATTILDEGGSKLSLCGFCWKLSEENSAEPTWEDNTTNVAAQSSAISVRIKDLIPNKSYLVRAYGVNGRGVGYGKTITVSTNNATVPAVSSITPGDSTATSISVKAGILSAGESSISEIGFCWSSENQEPTTAHLKYNATNQLGQAEFNTKIADLKPETTYYIRAYAINEQGTGYGDVYTFATGRDAEPGIYSLQDLVDFREARNAGNDVSKWKNSQGVINIFADIDMNSIDNWTMISNINEGEILEGNGHKLLNLKMIYVSSDIQTFGFIGVNSGTIRNLIIGTGSKFIIPQTAICSNGAVNLGAFCMSNSGIIYKCTNYATIEGLNGFALCGGISCGNSGTIEECLNYGHISCTTGASGISAVSGGGSIINSRNYGIIEAVKGDNVPDAIAGIAWYVGTGKVIDCTNEGNVSSTFGGFIAGIGARMFGGSIVNCTNKGNISGNYIAAGGIVGEARLDSETWGQGSTVLKISDCKNMGSVTGTDYTGGICGIVDNNTVLTNNANNGIVNGSTGADNNAIGYDGRR